ncbi:hypothetical protein BS47DRAFT_1338886, partial [Hydnum rufescens UP504]
MGWLYSISYSSALNGLGAGEVSLPRDLNTRRTAAPAAAGRALSSSSRSPPWSPSLVAAKRVSARLQPTPHLFRWLPKGLPDNLGGRYLIIFADRATADEWWRAVYDSVASGYQRFCDVKRVSPQFYTRDLSSDGDIMQTINDH